MTLSIKDLSSKIQAAYSEGVSMSEAECLAGEFLGAMISLSGQLREADLNARMRKTGVKAVKAAVYLAQIQAADKKPSDVLLGAKVDMDAMVIKEQESLDTAEVDRDELERSYNICREAHLHFRGLAKGRYEG